MDRGRLLIVSNRLPVTARLSGGEVRLTAASGGLATGMKPWHEGSGGLWIGWPGDVARFNQAQRAALDAQLHDRNIVPVYLTAEQVDRYYNGFSNRVLWPLFHYQIDRVPNEMTGWGAYQQVNERFADVVAREYRPGDAIWVHDYQLMLLPALLRQRMPDARIGFFLHIPFPASEVFRILPRRREILRGLLGADLIGFHTFAYMRHFVAALLHIEGVEADIDRVRTGSREVRLGVFPMGIDAGRFARLAENREVIRAAEALRRDAGGRQVVLGVDRLDYTKGIPRRLQSVERLLTREPALRDRIRYIQVAVPSRGEVDQYQRFRREVEEIVGRINGTTGTLRSTPIHYMHRSVPPRDLVALYRAADVMLVTPLRDGMNLVAKEFVASRVDEDGVLLLSEFAGAAAELDGALSVNPYDIDGVADAIARGLAMPAAERRARMARLRRRVMEHDVHAWARSFIESLREGVAPARTRASRRVPSLDVALKRAREAPSIRLLVDYDGTLVPLARTPEEASPDPDLLRLLERLAVTPGIELELVSGRPKDTLAEWLDDIPVSVWAEHGLWHRRGPESPWEATATPPADWTSRLLPILEQYTQATPGSRVEVKTASAAWHYREADPEFGRRQAHELRMLLGDALSNQPFEVLEGKKVIEVRLRGVSKAIVAQRIQSELNEGTALIAIGDDRTDEDLFRALPESALTIAVGHRALRARYWVKDYRDVRRLLRTVAGQARVASQPGDERRTGARHA
ncbi:MAG TPA: bifunctional alpha,alpha-trehalose-phosphate synthase (UDP-forming)/trehalose-phosphatase [Vicinamibacterales bacterium]